MKNFRGEAEEEWVTKKKVEITTTKERTTFITRILVKKCKKKLFNYKKTILFNTEASVLIS